MKWILQTKSHSVKENSDKDLQFFLDMDMAVLGRPSEGKKMKCLSIWLFSFRAKANQLNVNFYGMRVNCFHCHYCLKPVFFQSTRSMQIRFVKNTSIFLIRNTKSADQRYVHLKSVEWFCMLGYRDVLNWCSLSKRTLQLLNLKSVHNINDFAVVLMSPLPRFCGAFVSDRGYLLPTSFTKCTMTSPFKI